MSQIPAGSHSGGAAATEGAAAGDTVRDGVNGVAGATESIRKGVNNFFDEALQPSAKHDADAGVTAHHKPAVGRTGEVATSRSTGNAASAGAGFSADAKKLGKSLETAIEGDKSA